MAKITRSFTGLEVTISIPQRVGKSKKYGAKVKFDPCNGNENIMKWPFIRVHNFSIHGEYDKNVDTDAIIKWIREHKKNIKKVNEGETDFFLFTFFLKFSRTLECLKYCSSLNQPLTGLPVKVWIGKDNRNYTEHTVMDILCTDGSDKPNFVGIVKLINPEQSIFIKKYEKHAHTISEWVKQYQKQLIDIYLGRSFCATKGASEK